MRPNLAIPAIMAGFFALNAQAQSTPPTGKAPATPPVALTIAKAGAGSGTVTSSDGKINCGSRCNATWPAGTQISITATPAAGSVFTGWSDSGNGNVASTLVNLRANASLTATFAAAPAPKTATLTVSRSGTGSGTVSSSDGKIQCGSLCSASYGSGSRVSLSAVPAAGSTFTGWSGAVSGTSASITVTIATANSVSATFSSSQAATPAFTLAQTLSDGAQRTTLAFAGLGLMTGNLEAQSFFPPGKVADYTGFQYLRDNDPDSMGHNTSFLTRVANNVLFILNDSQFAQLKALALAQQTQISLYGYKRYPLMKAFRRTLEGSLPTGSAGLNLNAVKKASRELYALDGQISFDRALLYANLIRSLDANQKNYLAAMKGKGWKSWPDVTSDQIKSKMSSLPQGTAVAVMTYASDLYSWYNGSIEADVYFCPERHGTYFGSFYMKDAPAVGHEGYSIDEQLTASAGMVLSDASKGYVTQTQATLISSLVDKQRANLYGGGSNIVSIRTQIATLLRSLITTTASADAVKAQVLQLSALYGDLDGANNHAYASVFAQVHASLSSDQKIKLGALRQSILSGYYSDGIKFDYSVATSPYLYSEVISDLTLLAPYIGNTDYLFAEP